MQFLKKNKIGNLVRSILIVVSFLLVGCNTQGSLEPYEELPLDKEYDIIGPIFPISSEDQLDFIDETISSSIDLTTYNTDLLISKGGNYLLSGALYGSIIVDTVDQNVHIFLDNVNIESYNGPALYVKSAGKIYITSLLGSSNAFKDTAKYSPNHPADACIYSNSDITLNGSGDFSIIGLKKNAIHCKDIVRILSSNLYIQSKEDGLQGNDGIYIANTNLSIESEKNGLITTKNGKNHRGDIELDNCQISIIAGKNGIICSNNLIIQDSSNYFNCILDDTSVTGEIIEKRN